MSAEIVKLLRKTPIFATLDSSSLKNIARFFKEKTYSSEEVLFKEGTLGDTLYIIKEGAIKITQKDRDGEKEKSRALRREGDIFGESGFLDESPRPATAQATKTTKVLQLSRSGFLTILNNHPLIAYQIVKVLSSRLKQSDLRIIEELKEKNEQLQQAYLSLQEKLKIKESEKGADKSSETVGERESSADKLLSFVPYPVICTGEDEQIFFFNKAAEREFGYRSEEILGKSIKMLWKESSWLPVLPAIQKELKEKKVWEGEMVAKKKNGEEFLSFTVITPIFDARGKNDGKLYFSQNVTLKRSREWEERLEEELAITQQTVEPVAELVQTELKKLSDAFETLPLELGEANLNRSQKKMTIMREALDNITRLISELTPTSSPEVTSEPLNLVGFLEEELLLLKAQKKFQDILLETHFKENTPEVKANRSQLQKLFHTILDNAVASLLPVLDRKRTITIEASGVNQNREVLVQISDNGMGISSSDVSKVLKGYPPTKMGKLGLALSSIARIVKRHQGSLEIYSDEGAYTLFVIKFPAYQEKEVSLPQPVRALEVQS